MKILSIDIGGTSIKSGIFVDHVLCDYQEHDNNGLLGGMHLIKNVIDIIKQSERCDVIGISTAGQVDNEKGSIIYANENIPGYTGMKIKEILEKEFLVPVYVENDVNAAALGEAYYGAGYGIKDFLCLTYGTGIGGSIVIHGDVYRGSSFSAGEVGAMITHPSERDSIKDKFSGCYEKYGSTTALVQRLKKIDSTLMNGRIIFQEIHRAEVKKEVDEWINEVTYGIISLIHILNPSAVILGGGIMEQIYVSQKVAELVVSEIMPSFSHVVIKHTTLGNKSGLYGMLHIVLSKG